MHIVTAASTMQASEGGPQHDDNAIVSDAPVLGVAAVGSAAAPNTLSADCETVTSHSMGDNVMSHVNSQYELPTSACCGACCGGGGSGSSR